MNNKMFYDNKGQTLVMFVLILPIILLVLIMVKDISSMVNIRIKLDNINYLVIDYGLDHLDDDNLSEKLKKIVLKNDPEIDLISITILEDEIEIKLTKENNLTIFKNYKIESNYHGYLKDDKVIERIK